MAVTCTAARGATLPADTLPPRACPAPARWIPAAAGAALIAEGAAATAAFPSRGAGVDPSARKNSSAVADVAQYLPVAFPWAMKAFGAPTRSGWGRMAVSQAFSTALMAGGVYATKHSVSRLRPDATDNRSFPSGHTAWAFMGATMTAIELGDLSPWYAVGAYTLATGVAVQRVMAARHHAADVVAGAGIGILAAEMGYYLGDVIFGDRDLNLPPRDFDPSGSNPSFVSLTTSMHWPLGRAVPLADGRLERLPSLSAGLRGGLALDDHWALTLTAMLLSTPMQFKQPLSTTFAGTLTSVGLGIAPVYTLPVSRRVSFTAEAGAGYYKHLNLRSNIAGLSAGWGTPQGHASVGALLNLTDHISCRASVGYHLTHYRYTLTPSPSGTPARASGTASSLAISLSTLIHLP